MMITEGAEAPDFEAADQNGKIVHLADFLGKWVLLWWYPRASSSQCTMQGINLEARRTEFERANAQIIGISFDSSEDNCAFQQAHNFGYPLLSDTAQTIGHAYDVVREESDRFFGLPLRKSFLITPDGRVARVYNVTDVDVHPDEVLSDISSLSAGGPAR